MTWTVESMIGTKRLDKRFKEEDKWSKENEWTSDVKMKPFIRSNIGRVTDQIWVRIIETKGTILAKGEIDSSKTTCLKRKIWLKEPKHLCPCVKGYKLKMCKVMI